MPIIVKHVTPKFTSHTILSKSPKNYLASFGRGHLIGCKIPETRDQPTLRLALYLEQGYYDIFINRTKTTTYIPSTILTSAVNISKSDKTIAYIQLSTAHMSPKKFSKSSTESFYPAAFANCNNAYICCPGMYMTGNIKDIAKADIKKDFDSLCQVIASEDLTIVKAEFEKPFANRLCVMSLNKFLNSSFNSGLAADIGWPMGRFKPGENDDIYYDTTKRIKAFAKLTEEEVLNLPVPRSGSRSLATILT